MSATRDQNGVPNNQQGEFSSKIPRGEPSTTQGHAPGVLVGNDAAPEFSAKTLPPGSAPAESTFKPNSSSETAPSGRYDDQADPESENTAASETLGGATSADVHTGLGHPGQGQTSSELRQGGTQSSGLEGRGASVVPSANLVDGSDPAFAKQNRAIDNEDAVVERGNTGGPAAEERYPETS